MGDFDKALGFTLRWEGGYVNHPLDPGGATNLGITQRVYTAWRKGRGLKPRSVRLIERAEAEAIYYERYWLAAGCNRLAWPLNLVLFDAAVNCGVGRAKGWLAQAQKWGRDGTSPLDLARDVVDLRVNHHIGLATNPLTAWRFRTFLRGWLNRCRDLKQAMGY